MKISKIGGIIAAANSKLAFPMEKIGSITAVKRIVQIFHQAGIFPIVVTTRTEDYEVRYELSASGVVFLPVEGEENPELIISAKAGIAFLQDKCERIVFVPVNIPLFSFDTLNKLLHQQGQLVIPSYNKHAGHPVIIDAGLSASILEYDGSQGLRGALARHQDVRQWVDVEDEYILMSIRNQDIAPLEAAQPLRPVVKLHLDKNTVVFEARAKLLLLLISHTKSVRSACNLMALSYSKAWEMINQTEAEMGFLIVYRKHGGSRGGRTDLTEKGYAFLKAYQAAEECIVETANNAFDGLMGHFK